MKRKLLSVGVVSLFFMVLCVNFPPIASVIAEDPEPGEFGHFNWEGEYDYGTIGPHLKGIRFYDGDENGYYVFKTINVPYFYVNGNICGLYDDIPTNIYEGWTSASPFRQIIEYNFSAPCIYSQSITVRFDLYQDGQFKITLKSVTTTKVSRIHLLYLDPRVSNGYDADTTNHAFYYSGVNQNDWKLWEIMIKRETGVYLDDVNGGNYDPEFYVFADDPESGVGNNIQFTEVPYPSWNDGNRNYLMINKCNTGSTGCDYNYPSQYTNGPWSYDDSQDISGANHHLVHRSDTINNTYYNYETVMWGKIALQ